MTCSERTAALLAAALLAGCAGAARVAVFESAPVPLPLAGPLNTAAAEVSGMAWHGDTLVFLPQYPDRFGAGGDLAFFGLARADVEAVLDGTRTAPLEPFPIPCAAPWLARMIAGYDGLESVGVLGDQCFMTIEATRDTGAAGYLASGRWSWDGAQLRVDLERLTTIPLTATAPDMADETLVMDGERVITISEANGRAFGPHPSARVFDRDLGFRGTLPFPVIEYRVTDATALDAGRRFWVLNYLYPPEAPALRPQADPETARFGAPPWLDGGTCIERLLELRITDDDRIVRTATPPLWLPPAADGLCRNWEGVVRLGDRGFLLITDEHPATMLAFVPLPAGLAAADPPGQTP